MEDVTQGTSGNGNTHPFELFAEAIKRNAVKTFGNHHMSVHARSVQNAFTHSDRRRCDGDMLTAGTRLLLSFMLHLYEVSGYEFIFNRFFKTE